ncbi:vacuolar sorting protein VPS33/slp1 [Lobulomyces angularis]|nr:vacuolar sorting protein VPS33/slp1 [Lobulomyces angularis]
MLSVFSTLAESPIIRYYDPSNLKVNKSYQLATALQTELDNFIKEDPEFPSKDAEYRAEGKGTVIIVERNFDMVAPLLHEFTYQAMLNDLLVLKNGKYSFKIEAEEDQKAGMATIDENDDIWRLIRHWHFADAVEYISGTFEKFISNNKAAAAALGHNEGPQGIESLNNMKDTLSALPEFQEMKTKFSLHINICQECKTVFEQRNLNLLAGIEQNLATGETAEGKTVRNGMQDLVPVLYDKSVPNVDKIRLLMLYIICQDGINDNDRRKLLEYAKLSIEECQAITNLSLLGLRLVPLTTSLEKKQVADLRGPYTYRGKKGDKRRTTNDDMAYDLSRYVPLLKLVMEDEMSQTISQKYFPFTVEPPTNATLKRNKASNEIKVSSQPQVVNGVLMGTGQNPYSLRTLRASWASSPTKKKISGADDNGKKPENDKLELDPDALLLKEYRKNGPRLIVFVIGGMTYSEMRSCYEVMRDSRREVIIGSTHILKPQAFVETLKDLHKQDIKLGNAAKTNPLLSRNSIAEIVETPSTLTSSNSVYSMNPEKEKKNFNLFRKKTATTAVKK